MLYYHGTTERVAEAIKREGLKPHRETAYQLTIGESGSNLRELPGEKEQIIYLTEHLSTAHQFAIYRAKYEMTKFGEVVDLPFFPLQVKKTDSCECIEKPVVITFQLPQTILKQLDQDLQTFFGKICTCTVPPAYIVRVDPADIRIAEDDAEELEQQELVSYLFGIPPEVTEAALRRGYKL